MVVRVGLAPFYLDVDDMGVLLSGRAWLILAWEDHRDTDRERERERFNSIWFVRGSHKGHAVHLTSSHGASQPNMGFPFSVVLQSSKY